MLRRHVESWTRGPREGLLQLAFFFLKAAPPAVSLPAFLLLESAIVISAVVSGEICRYDEAEWAYVNGKFDAPGVFRDQRRRVKPLLSSPSATGGYGARVGGWG